MEAIRKTPEARLRYLHEQGRTPRGVTPDELIAPETHTEYAPFMEPV